MYEQVAVYTCLDYTASRAQLFKTNDVSFVNNSLKFTSSDTQIC